MEKNLDNFDRKEIIDTIVVYLNNLDRDRLNQVWKNAYDLAAAQLEESKLNSKEFSLETRKTNI
jgi:hypothetical protein